VPSGPVGAGDARDEGDKANTGLAGLLTQGNTLPFQLVYKASRFNQLEPSTTNPNAINYHS
jgi:hypothetical protein